MKNFLTILTVLGTALGFSNAATADHRAEILELQRRLAGPRFPVAASGHLNRSYGRLHRVHNHDHDDDYDHDDHDHIARGGRYVPRYGRDGRSFSLSIGFGNGGSFNFNRGIRPVAARQPVLVPPVPVAPVPVIPRIPVVPHGPAVSGPALPAPIHPGHLAHDPMSFRFGQFVDCEVPIYQNVLVKDTCNIAPNAVPVVVAARDPHCRLGSRVFVQIFVPPCDPQRVKVYNAGRSIDYDFGKYEVDIRSRLGKIIVDYDD